VLPTDGIAPRLGLSVWFIKIIGYVVPQSWVIGNQGRQSTSDAVQGVGGPRMPQWPGPTSWVSAAAGNFWVLWTGSGPTGLLDMCTALGGGPLGQLSSFFQPCLHVKPSQLEGHRAQLS